MKALLHTAARNCVFQTIWTLNDPENEDHSKFSPFPRSFVIFQIPTTSIQIKSCQVALPFVLLTIIGEVIRPLQQR